MIRIMIVDDHQLFVDALKTMLADEADMEVVATAHEAKRAFQVLGNQEVDIVLMDIRLGESQMNGMEAAEHINEHFPTAKVIILTMLKEGKFIARMLKHNISGYMIKHSAGGDLVKALKLISKGETYYSMEVMKAHMDYVRQINVHGPSVHLTQREQEILQLLVEEYSTTEIGEKLCIGEAGVETHRRNLRKKLKVKNTAGLVREALIRDLVDTGKFSRNDQV